MIKNRFRLSRLEVIPVKWPLRWTFATALGAKSFTDNVVVEAILSGGAAGYGEASSSLAMAFQTQTAMASSLRRLGRLFRGDDIRDAEKIVERAWQKEGQWPSAVAAFEAALWDALARACGTPFAALWGGPVRKGLTTTLSVPTVSPENAGELVGRYFRRGFRLFKLKLNGREPIEINLQRILAASRAAPRGRFILDPNQSCSPESLRELLARVAKMGLETELVEEPFRKNSWSDYASFYRTAKIPMILDESVRTPEDAEKAAKCSAGVNIKLAKSGLMKSREILRMFPPRSALMIGCMAESKLGLAASIHWACALGVFDYVDLDSDLFVSAGGIRGGYERKGPEVLLPNPLPPGLGVEWRR